MTFKKLLQNKKAQSTLEYLIYFTITSLVVAASISTILSKAKESGDILIERAISKIDSRAAIKVTGVPVSPPEPCLGLDCG